MEEKIITLKNLLRSKGIRLLPGLTEEEFLKIEEIYGITFPADLHMIYENFIPISKKPRSFYNWHDFSPQNIAHIKKKIFRAYKYFIPYMRPFYKMSLHKDMDQLTDEALILTLPQLIPIYGHRFMPASPEDAGNPVFSIVGTDMIYYGSDIFNYFDLEFAYEPSTKERNDAFEAMRLSPVKPIFFWDDMLDCHQFGDFDEDDE